MTTKPPRTRHWPTPPNLAFSNNSSSSFSLERPINPASLDLCAGARQALTDYYNADIRPLEKNVGYYPNTTTTYEPNYGFLCGVEYQIRVRSTPANSGSNFNLWLNAIPYTEGLYLVGYLDPVGAYEVWLPVRKKFTDTLFFKSKALSSTLPCNYKGQSRPLFA